MKARKNLNEKRVRRTQRTRAKITGTAARPRLTIFRSNKGVYAQLIDDIKGVTLVAASTQGFTGADVKKSKSLQAERVGELIAEKAKQKGITSAVCDRRSYKYHGRVKALVEAAKKSGLAI